MALRQILSKAVILPNLERDLSRTLNAELLTVPNMTDCMVAPYVYGYQSSPVSVSDNGAFSRTSSRQQAGAGRLVKIEYVAPPKGLFS